MFVINIVCVVQAKDKGHWQKLFSQFCSRAANEEEEIAHKLLGEKFRVNYCRALFLMEKDMTHFAKAVHAEINFVQGDKLLLIANMISYSKNPRNDMISHLRIFFYPHLSIEWQQAVVYEWVAFEKVAVLAIIQHTTQHWTTWSMYDAYN